MPNSPRKIPLTIPPCFQKRETKSFHRYVVCSIISQTNGWMNPSWVSYPFSLLKKKPSSISTTTVFWLRTCMCSCSSSPHRACSSVHQYWLTCSCSFKQINSRSSCRKWTGTTYHNLSLLGLRYSEVTPQNLISSNLLSSFTTQW
jgi:hypothetical protein